MFAIEVNFPKLLEMKLFDICHDFIIIIVMASMWVFNKNLARLIVSMLFEYQIFS